MKITLGKKLFFFTGATVILLLLSTFLVLERTQSRQWEEYLRAQSVSFARFATPEVLKRFRGAFPLGGDSVPAGLYEFLTFNPDLVRFSLISPTARVLFESDILPGYSGFNPGALKEGDLVARLQVPEITVRTWDFGGKQRLLDVLAPAFGPTGEHLISVRYLFSYESVDNRLQDMRQQFFHIALISVGFSLLIVALVARRTTQPIKDLTEGARAVARGELHTRIAGHRGDEIGSLAAAFNEMAGSLAISQDELTKKNEALLRANLELQQVQERMIRAERLAAIGQLAAGVSHEIDNPVGIILGYAELLLEDIDAGDPRRDDVQAIVDECKRCRRITGGLLGFARSSESRRETVDLSGLIRETVSSVRPQKLFRHVTTSLDVPEGPFEIEGDGDQLRQVLINLFLNAAQAMEGKGTLAISLSSGEDRVLLDVDDSGPGIAPAMKETIFDPFFTTKAKGEGTGLGLSVCRKLVEDHGGRLWAEQAPGGGARFRIELPRGNPEKVFDKDQSDSLV